MKEWFGSAEWSWPTFFERDVEAWLKAQQSLTPAVDWVEVLFGPFGFELVLSHLLFAVPVLGLSVGVGRK
jgi:hypothetical protein